MDRLCPWVEDSGCVATSELGLQTQADPMALSLQIPVSVPFPHHAVLPASSHVLTPLPWDLWCATLTSHYLIFGR